MPPIRWGAADTCTHLSHNGTTAREMDFPTRTAKERAAHYEQEAEKFRRMAEAEPVENIRQESAGDVAALFLSAQMTESWRTTRG